MLRKHLLHARVGLLAAGSAAALFAGDPPSWSMNATGIEACSCPMFCQCYFNTQPAAHHDHGGAKHYCKANAAYKVNKGYYGATKLDGAKFWLYGDLGGDFSKGDVDWAVITFDKATTPEQREALKAIMGHLMPVKWKSLTFAEGNIDVWEASKDMARATLDGGATAEVKLKRAQGMTDDPIVIQNLRYWGAPRNSGFVLMPNEVEALRKGDQAFEYKGSNGFMITFDIASKDVAKGGGM